MLNSIIIIIILLNYISIALELFLLPVPSVASTYQLIFKQDLDLSIEKNSLLSRVKSWPKSKKILLLIIPAGINILIYFIPLILVIFPNIKSWLSPISINGLFWIVSGVLLISLGRWLTIRAAIRIRKNNTQIDDQFYLHDKGIFANSRNPGLLGMYINIIGLWMLFPSLIFFVGIFFYIAYMHFKVILEEEFLFFKFGDAYTSYLEKTPRYLIL